MTAVILRGDAGCLPLPDASVDLIVTSPPYWGQRSYTDGGEVYEGQIGSEKTPQQWLEAMLACTREWMRVLKPQGSIFVDLGDKYSARADSSAGRSGRWDHVACLPPARNSRSLGRPKSLLLLPERYRIACVDQLGLIARAKIVWSKPSPLPEAAQDRVQTAHEDIVHLVKQPRYFSALGEIRVPHSGNAHSSGNGASRRWRTSNAGRNHRALDTDPSEYNPAGKLPGSVWEIASVPLIVPEHLGEDHFAAYPPELVRRIILGWCPSGGVVADPFGGTGTTALVADVLGRTGITIDRSAGYCRTTAWRTTDPAERARALGVSKPPPVPDGQGSLFEAGEAS